MRIKKTICYLVLSLTALAPIQMHAAASAPAQEQAPIPQATEAPVPLIPTPPDATCLTEQPAVSYESAFVKMLLTLGGLILVVFLTIWILRRLGQGKFRGLGGGRAIEILEKRPLSAKSMLYLVQVGTKQVLISESQFEVRKIASLNEIAETEAD